MSGGDWFTFDPGGYDPHAQAELVDGNRRHRVQVVRRTPKQWLVRALCIEPTFMRGKWRREGDEFRVDKRFVKELDT